MSYPIFNTGGKEDRYAHKLSKDETKTDKNSNKRKRSAVAVEKAFIWLTNSGISTSVVHIGEYCKKSQ